MSAAPAVAPRLPAAPPEMLRVYQPWHAPPLVRVPMNRLEAVRGALTAAGFETWESDLEITPFLPDPYTTLVFMRWESDIDAAQRVLDALPAD